MPQQLQWEDARRLESWAGEVRVNLIRLIAVLVFYGHHLVSYYVLTAQVNDARQSASYHAIISLLALAWAATVLVLHFCLSRRWMPPALKFVVTSWDIVLITLVLMVGGPGGAFGTLPVLYFLVVIGVSLRLSLPLVYFGTLGSMGAYVFWLGYLSIFLRVPDGGRLPQHQQIIFVLALGGAGIIAGQMVRQARRLVHGYAVAIDESKEEEQPNAS